MIGMLFSLNFCTQ